MSEQPSSPTRERIIRAAERLMAERGIEGVDLKEIQIAAGQRNRSAINYHFGDRTGLVAAIAAKHRTAINEERNRLLDRLEASRDRSIRPLVDAGIRPLAALLADPSGRDYTIIAAEATARAGTQGLFAVPRQHIDSVQRFIRMVTERVPGPPASRQLLAMRAVIVMAILLADIARLINQQELTVAQGKRRVAGIVDFVTRALTVEHLHG